MAIMYLSYLTGIAGRSSQVAMLQPAGGPALRLAGPERWLILAHALCFVAGFSLIFIALGATASVLGGFLRLHLEVVRHVTGILIVLFGLHTASVARLSWLYRERRAHIDPTVGTGVGRSALLGLAFGTGWSPCVGPMLGSILMTASSDATLGHGVLLLLTYSVGLGIPFLAAAIFVQGLAGRLRGLCRHSALSNTVAGVLLVAMGVMVYTNVFARLAGLVPVLL